MLIIRGITIYKSQILFLKPLLDEWKFAKDIIL